MFLANLVKINPTKNWHCSPSVLALLPPDGGAGANYTISLLIMHFRVLTVRCLAGCQLVVADLPDPFELPPAPSSDGMLLKQRNRLAICGDSGTQQKGYPVTYTLTVTPE